MREWDKTKRNLINSNLNLVPGEGTRTWYYTSWKLGFGQMGAHDYSGTYVTEKFHLVLLNEDEKNFNSSNVIRQWWYVT